MADAERKYRKKKKLGSYPFFSVVFSTSLALFAIGLFGLLVLHTNRLTEIIQENVEIQVYLDKQVSENDRIKIQKTIEGNDFVYQSPDGVSIQFISKEDAAEQFIAETGEDFLQFLGDNPLRDLFIIRVNPEFHQTEQLESIEDNIESISGVYDVVYAKSLVESINQNLAKLSMILIGFSVILLLTVIILINNTIKLALFSQRFLIRSMQLVGATATFIQKPFLLRASLYGLLSGAISIALIYAILTAANAKIEDLSLLQDNQRLLILFASLLMMGILLGFFSTYRAIRKYLKMSLDELY